VRPSSFDEVRLSREAKLAGEAFGCESVPEARPAESSSWLWWVAGALAVVGFVGLNWS
jgi:hypothetical protein